MTTVEDCGEPRTPIKDFAEQPIPFFVAYISDAPVSCMAIGVGRDDGFVFAIEFHLPGIADTGAVSGVIKDAVIADLGWSD